MSARDGWHILTEAEARVMSDPDAPLVFSDGKPVTITLDSRTRGGGVPLASEALALAVKRAMDDGPCVADNPPLEVVPAAVWVVKGETLNGRLFARPFFTETAAAAYFNTCLAHGAKRMDMAREEVGS